MTNSEKREAIILKNGGQQIFGIFHRPLTVSNCPAVLICHGLGGHKVGKHRLYVQLAHQLASLGVAALRIDFRGSGDSEGEFGDMTIESEVSDALHALEFLKNDPQVDPQRIAIFGRSFGGVVAVLAAHTFGDIKSMVLWAPVFSGDQWREKWEMVTTSKLPDEHRDEMMSIEGMKPGPKFFEQLFRLKLGEKLKTLGQLPLLHIHGKKDALVSTHHADLYEEARSQAEGVTKFVRLSDTDHDFSNAQERRKALEESLAWFRKTLDID